MTPRRSAPLLLVTGLCLASLGRGLRTYQGSRRQVAPGLVQEVETLTSSARCPEAVWRSEERLPAPPERPSVPSLPFVTSIPVYYVTSGGPREDKFLELFKDFSPHMHRVLGIDGSNLSALSRLVARSNETIGLLLEKTVPGRVAGCMLAHMQAIHRAYTSGAEVALVLEDDAVPLTPWWPSSLEELALSLPDDWHAVQMQWSANVMRASDYATAYAGNYSDRNYSDLLELKMSSQSRPFEMGTGWGTAAYMISRKGMLRVVSDVWSTAKRKFNVLDILKKCKKFSADDCLLGFTDTGNKKTMQQVERTTPIRHEDTYRATPPYFLHGSVRRKVHRVNLCLDVLAASAGPPLPLPWTRLAGSGRRRLLLFVPARLGGPSAGRMMLNVEHARSTAGHDCCDLFPAFRSAPAHVHKVAQPRVSKFELLAEHFRSFGGAWAEAYDYVWVLDPDMDITREDVAQLLEAARDARAAVAEPLTSQASGQASLSEAAASVYHLRSSVNLTAPLIRTDAIQTILAKIDRHRNAPLLRCAGFSGLSTLYINESGLSDGAPGSPRASGADAAPRCVGPEATVLRA